MNWSKTLLALGLCFSSSVFAARPPLVSAYATVMFTGVPQKVCDDDFERAYMLLSDELSRLGYVNAYIDGECDKGVFSLLWLQTDRKIPLDIAIQAIRKLKYTGTVSFSFEADFFTGIIDNTNIVIRDGTKVTYDTGILVSEMRPHLRAPQFVDGYVIENGCMPYLMDFVKDVRPDILKTLEAKLPDRHSSLITVEAKIDSTGVSANGNKISLLGTSHYYQGLGCRPPIK